MSLLRRTLRVLVLLLAGFLSQETAALGASPAPIDTRMPAAAFALARVEPARLSAAPTVIFGVLPGQIIGNRSRMIQMAFIAFAIGIAILVTATRKY